MKCRVYDTQNNPIVPPICEAVLMQPKNIKKIRIMWPLKFFKKDICNENNSVVL
mgnify:CR=1 FL=1